MPAANTRLIAIELLKAGLATQAEAARLAGVSRQAVQQWCEREQFDAAALRDMWLRKAWKAAVR